MFQLGNGTIIHVLPSPLPIRGDVTVTVRAKKRWLGLNRGEQGRRELRSRSYTCDFHLHFNTFFLRRPEEEREEEPPSIPVSLTFPRSELDGVLCPHGDFVVKLYMAFSRM